MLHGGYTNWTSRRLASCLRQTRVRPASNNLTRQRLWLHPNHSRLLILDSVRNLSTITTEQTLAALDQPIYDHEEAEDEMDTTSTPSEHPNGTFPTNRALKEAHEMLVDALSAGDMSMITRAWSRLREMKLLTPGLVPLSYFRRYSKFISEMDFQGNDCDSSAMQALDELAAYAVIYDDGLCSRARHYLDNNDPDAALRILQMAYSLLQERNSLLRQLATTLSPDEYHQVTAVSGKARILPYGCIAHALAACVMKGSLRPMLGLGIYDSLLGSTTQQLMAYTTPIAEELALSTSQFQRFVRRFVNLRLFAREPAVFARYVSQIEDAPNTKSFAYLAEFITSELSEDEPCLTLDPTAAAVVASEYALVILQDAHWAQLMRSLIRARRVDDAERLWVDMTRLDVKIPMLVWAAVIEGFGALRMFSRVRAAWNTFCSMKLAPRAGAVVYRAYITALFDEGRPKDALDIFEAFNKCISKEPESVESESVVSVYNVVLEWLVQQSRIAEARQILDRMKASGSTRPDVESYNIFIQHASRSKDLKAIADIIREMQALGMTSNVYTASVLLAAVYSVRTDAIELVLALMQQAGVQVHGRTVNSLLDHLVRLLSDDAIPAAIRLLDYMETSQDIQPVEMSYIQVLCGIERRVWRDPALAARYRRTVIEKMARRHRRLTRSAATRKVIVACFEHPGPEGVWRAMIYYDHYRKDRLRGGLKFENTVWGTLLQQLSSRREWAIADELSREIVESGQTVPPGLRVLLDRVRSRISDVVFDHSV